MRINVSELLRSHNVPFVERGHNVAQGHINVKCPFCGSADPSEHMGIRIADGAWGCWRNSRHRGKNPARLFQVLFKISFNDAQEITGRRHISANPLDQVENLLRPKAPSTVVPDQPIFLPDEFRWIDTGRAGARFVRYLVSNRRIPLDLALKLSDDYEMCYALSGKWKDRIVFPVFTNGLEAWTGRSIHRRPHARYLASKPEEVDPTGGRGKAIHHCLWNYDNLTEGGKTLLISEGPFDALQIDLAVRDTHVRATCLFGLTLSDAQLGLLYQLRNKFDNLLLALDANTTDLALHMMQKLLTLDPGVITIPPQYKDPGSMPLRSIRKWISEVPNL